MEFLQKAAGKAAKAAKAASYAYHGYGETEIKVLEATGKENWGVHGQAQQEIARLTRNRDDYQLVMKILWQRLEHTGEEWRHVYKALTVMEFLVAHGAEEVARELQGDIRKIRRLENFHYKEPSGRDQGINVRQKSSNLVALLSDKSKIAEARDKAIMNRDKYGGISSEDMRSGRVNTTARSTNGTSSYSSKTYDDSARGSSKDAGVSDFWKAPSDSGASSRSAYKSPSPVAPAGDVDQPNFADFGDSVGDFEDDSALSKTASSGFIPKIKVSTTAIGPSSAPIGLAPPPGMPGGNRVTAPPRQPEVAAAAVDLFGDFAAPVSAPAAPAPAADLFGDFAAVAPVSSAPKPDPVMDLFGDFSAPAAQPPPAQVMGAMGISLGGTAGDGGSGGAMGNSMGVVNSAQPIGGVIGAPMGQVNGMQPMGHMTGAPMGQVNGMQPMGQVNGMQQPMMNQQGGYMGMPQQRMIGMQGGMMRSSMPMMMGGDLGGGINGGVPGGMQGCTMESSMPMNGGMSGGMGTVSRMRSQPPADPFFTSASSTPTKGHRRTPSTGSDALNGLTADFLAMEMNKGSKLNISLNGNSNGGSMGSGGPMNGGNVGLAYGGSLL